MASVTIAIGSPVLVPPATVHVVVKNSAGGLIRESDEGNDSFTITGLAPDDYTMTVTNGDNVQVECFSITPCGCPTVTDAAMTARGDGTYDFTITFDFSSYSPSFRCGFAIYGLFADHSSFFIGTYTSASLIDIGGGLFQFKYFASTNSSVTYRISAITSPFDGDLSTCVPDTVVNASCGGPLINNIGLSAKIIYDGTDHKLNIDYGNCGTSCHDVTWNYVQTGVLGGATPDSGTFTDTVTCSPLGSSSHTVHPYIATAGFPTTYRGYSYDLVGTDCCGNTYITTITCNPSIRISDLSISAPTLKTQTISYNNCGTGSCGGDDMNIYVHYVQNDAQGGFTPDSGDWVDTRLYIFTLYNKSSTKSRAEYAWNNSKLYVYFLQLLWLSYWRTRGFCNGLNKYFCCYSK